MTKLFSVALLVLPWFLVSCKEGSRRKGTDATYIIPQKTSAQNEITPPEKDHDLSYHSFIPTPEGMIFLRSEAGDMDQDGHTEQALIMQQNTGDQAWELFLLSVGLQLETKEYIETGRFPLKAVRHHPITFYLRDLTGDHFLEVIVLGMDRDRHQTAEIFKVAQDKSPFALYPILSLTVEGLIDIAESAREASYAAGKAGNALAIIAQENDLQKKESLDLIKKTYQWDLGQNAYLLKETLKIPGEEIHAAQLRSLFRSSETNLENFLSGVWRRYIDSDGKPTNTFRTIIHFRPKEEEVAFYNSEALTVYTWKTSFRTVYNGLKIHATNLLIPSLSRTMSLIIEDIDLVKLRVMKSFSDWDGTYKRLTPSEQRAIADRDLKTSALTRAPFRGLFENTDGLSMHFTPPFFTMHHKEKISRGSISTYKVGGTEILELQLLNGYEIAKEVRMYRFLYSETHDDLRIIRTLALTPGELTINGFSPQEGKGEIRLEQIEIKGATMSFSAPMAEG